jgi:hypothetical protein
MSRQKFNKKLTKIVSKINRSVLSPLSPKILNLNWVTLSHLLTTKGPNEMAQRMMSSFSMRLTRASLQISNESKATCHKAHSEPVTIYRCLSWRQSPKDVVWKYVLTLKTQLEVIFPSKASSWQNMITLRCHRKSWVSKKGTTSQSWKSEITTGGLGNSGTNKVFSQSTICASAKPYSLWKLKDTPNYWFELKLNK